MDTQGEQLNNINNNLKLIDENIKVADEKVDQINSYYYVIWYKIKNFIKRTFGFNTNNLTSANNSISTIPNTISNTTSITTSKNTTSKNTTSITLQSKTLSSSEFTDDQKINNLLDDASKGVSQLKDKAIIMNKTLDTHIEILNTIDDNIVDVNQKTKNVNRKIFIK